ncbi:MAG: hypothetical protein IJI14_04855 [Anaerolineaceae bacterium]|nr:hypothetical protein [Anaerolineaceae bacterium]
MTQQDYNPNVLIAIQTTLSQYPILTEKIENEMYNRLLLDGYISVSSFTEKVRDFALFSQKREGLENPYAQEPSLIWEKRLERVQSMMICREFAERYPLDVFNSIVAHVVKEPGLNTKPAFMWHNVQYATIETIIEQALTIEHLPHAERKQYEAQLMAAKVALIRKMLSNRIPYITVAKEVFSIHDLLEINRHRIGQGLIGSKAAELVLANRILHNSEDEDIRSAVGDIESIFIGSDVFYNFMMINNLMGWYDQKYKDDNELWQDFPRLEEEFLKGEMPQEIVKSLRDVLTDFNGAPYIVRSSSKLEDSFTHPFNSMYRSIPLANQGTADENLKALLDAIRKIYASTFNPNALTYRKKNGLVDYTEEMAILIQKVPGRNSGPYYFPDISGIGGSRSPYKWKQDSPKDEGFLRFVVGLGSHGTSRNGDDYPNIVELSEPNRRHTTYTYNEKYNTQQTMLVLNFKTNQPEILDVQDVLSGNYPPLYLVAQKSFEDSFQSLQRGEDTDYYNVTCEDLIRKTNFTRLMRDILHTLERAYGKPVLVEFTAMLDLVDIRSTNYKIQIHNCRPALLPDNMQGSITLSDTQDHRLLLTSDLFVGNGVLSDIRYVVYVDPLYYQKLYGRTKIEFCELLNDINLKLANENFIFVAASRWGAMENHGIPTEYRQIANAKALVELSGTNDKTISDPFCGTRFFQSILESGIYSIITNADKTEDIDTAFFTDSIDLTEDFVGVPQKFKKCVRILSTANWYGSRSLTIEMDGDIGFVQAYFI